MPGSSAVSNAEKLERLLAWFEENEVKYNQEAIHIVERQVAKAGSNIVSSDGFGVMARRDLIDEEPLVMIPKAAVLSSATSPLANIFEDEELGGSLALCISVMYEMSLGEDSPWCGYLQSLPERADIPMLWDAKARSWLQGTNVARWVERDERNLRDDFEVLQKLVGDYPLVFRSGNGIKWDRFEDFLAVASLVSSRAFMVDVHRGNSMVPFADIFNHKTAGENVHIESEEMVCPLCGEAFGCEHMEGLELRDQEEGEEGEGEGEEGEDEDGEDEHSSHYGSEDDEGDDWEDEDDGSEDGEEEEIGEELPVLIDERGEPIEVEDESEKAGDEEDEESEMESGSDDEDGKWDDTLDMVVFKTCRAGSEVFNTYGEHGSAYLLHRYGFCDKHSPFEAVVLDSGDVLQAFAVAVSEKRSNDIAEVIARFRDLFVPHHRAKEQDSKEGEEDSDEHDGHSDDGEDVAMMDDADEEADSDDSEPPTFSVDAPGHPNLNLVTLLALGFAEEAAFVQASQSDEIFRHYFPIMRQFWSTFQDKLDAGASVSAAYREANKDSVVKKKTAVLVCRASYLLAEKRMAQVADDNILGQRPTDHVQLCRWESAKQLRSNERKVLQHCIKTYKKAVSKLS
ncbi:SET domain-containing protein [Martensiomyces pterosporus]|nr:SET domain-containing protein [Martensiomyces pterosporus]